MTPLTITVRKDGSLFIAQPDAAEVRLVDHEGTEIALPAGKGIALCRCGASKRKPFCDASHKAIGWDGTLAPAAAPAPAAPAAPAAPPAPAGGTPA